MFSKKKKEEQKQDTPQQGIDIAYYEKMINDLLTSYGLDPEKCRHRPKTLWSAYRGSALIYTEIFKLNDVDYIEVSCPVSSIPSRNLLPFYRKLLEINYQLMGVKFFVRDDLLYLSENRELKGLDKDELAAMQNRVSFHADKLDDELIKEFKTRDS
ncbi:YbjN domain-containing protein [candidate division WOR-3 bacterium]|nr:YbjN domain-containing protein [candidate division WOR-3 bacterium]